LPTREQSRDGGDLIIFAVNNENGHIDFPKVFGKVSLKRRLDAVTTVKERGRRYQWEKA
jgi:hypothetical protein